MNELLQNFHFMRPLWLLAVLPVVPVAVMIWRRLNSGQAWTSIISPELLPHLIRQAGGQRSGWPPALLLLAWLASVLALAGPTWEKLPLPVERKEDALVVVYDLSTSMYAEDIAPSRLVRSRQKLMDLLVRKTEGTTGLVAYAGDAHVVSPLTDDLRTVANLLPALAPDIMPVKGSRPGPAVAQAVRLLRDSGLEHGQILLVSDGIRAGDSDDIAEALAGTAYRLSVLGVGTEEGSPIPTSDGFLRDGDGNIVIPGLDRRPLTRLASRFGGTYSDIQLGDADIERILRTDVWDDLQSEQLLDRSVDTWQDMGFWLVILLVPIALGAFRRGWLLCLVFLLPMPEQAAAQDLSELFLNQDQRASRLLEQGEPKAAAAEFENPDWAAAASYRAGDYQSALQHYREQDDADGWYNRGNSLAKAGKLAEAVEAYQQALVQQPDMEDAAFNKFLVEQLLEQQQQQQQQQGSGENSQQQQSEQDSQQQQQSQGDPRQEQDGDQQTGREQAQQQQAQNQPPDESGKAGEEEQQAQAAEQEASDQEGEEQSAMARDAEDIEREMANEQWLRRIPDDPSGLLRRKFRYESRLRAGDVATQPGSETDEPNW